VHVTTQSIVTTTRDFPISRPASVVSRHEKSRYEGSAHHSVFPIFELPQIIITSAIMARFPSSPASWATALVSCLAIINTIIPSVAAQDTRTISGTNADGVTQTLLVDRTPALFTGDFGDCMGGNSLMNITSFDAAYYADNMTVLFNLAGTSNLLNQSLMCMLSSTHCIKCSG
jgi:hypothetical protein